VADVEAALTRTASRHDEGTEEAIEEIEVFHQLQHVRRLGLDEKEGGDGREGK